MLLIVQHCNAMRFKTINISMEQGFFYDLHRLLQVRHVTNTVIGSSELLVCME